MRWQMATAAPRAAAVGSWQRDMTSRVSLLAMSPNDFLIGPPSTILFGPCHTTVNKYQRCVPPTMLSQPRSEKSNRSRGVWSRSTRRTTSTGTTTPRKNTESAIGRRSSKMNNHLLGDGQEVADVAKSQTILGRSTYMYGLATEDITKSKAKLGAHGARMRKQPPPPPPPLGSRKSTSTSP